MNKLPPLDPNKITEQQNPDQLSPSRWKKKNPDQLSPSRLKKQPEIVGGCLLLILLCFSLWPFGLASSLWLYYSLVATMVNNYILYSFYIWFVHYYPCPNTACVWTLCLREIEPKRNALFQTQLLVWPYILSLAQLFSDIRSE